MSAAAEFTVFLIGSDVLADRSLHRHLAKQYAVHSARKAADIDKLMLAQTPDVVVCEQHLADARGVDVLRRMRIEHPYAVRVLTLRRAGRDEMVRAINEAAVYQVISPPFDNISL